MYYLLMLLLAILDPTAFTFGVMISLCSLIFVLSLFYVNFRVLIMVILIVFARFTINNFLLVDMGQEQLATFAKFDSMFKLADILLGILLIISILMGVVIGRPLIGESLYQVIRRQWIKRKATRAINKAIGK
ncbi:hypothetical protein [Acinetobacter beijerinckii]|uniref:Uncharacterized protein n=1 Tax=Acinetobacter beijerinckii CIP 110307 TaxID=1217648 RepID=N9DYA6_9GAMM|nr:hypothetical protein [Acinetobacter beijerinckii]ENW02917.1 hypothetical protein F933_03323 [Acinetobacter beijerinckii CIP 110307]